MAAGIDSLYSSRIRGIRNLYANGEDVLSLNEIFTEQARFGGMFYATINGTNFEDYHITCSRKDTCRIKCLSDDACTKMNLYCYGTCFVLCNEINGGNIACPVAKYGSYSIFETDAPSYIPSNLPSVAPTVNPTSVPTVPTFNPSLCMFSMFSMLYCGCFCVNVVVLFCFVLFCFNL